MRSALFLAALVAFAAGSVFAADAPPPGAMRLLPGYVHEPLQGIDSIVGRIRKPGGLTIQYEIGRVPKPGGLRIGGDFSDAAVGMPEKDRRWYREQTVQGEPVHIAYSKADLLVVSFPASGLNLTATAKSSEEVADVLLMALTYPKQAAAKP